MSRLLPHEWDRFAPPAPVKPPRQKPLLLSPQQREMIDLAAIGWRFVFVTSSGGMSYLKRIRGDDEIFEVGRNSVYRRLVARGFFSEAGELTDQGRAAVERMRT